jgi:hypothetical protein
MAKTTAQLDWPKIALCPSTTPAETADISQAIGTGDVDDDILLNL